MLRLNPYGLLILVVTTLWLAGCEPEYYTDNGRALTPHEVYAQSLQIAGVDQTLLGRAWLAASKEALAAPLPVTPPFREVGYFASEQAHAMAYQVTLTLGQRMKVDLAIDGPVPGRLFMDLYEVSDDATQSLKQVAHADSTHRLLFDATGSHTYILRIQPELLQGGQYTLTIEAGASVTFPVSGNNSSAIQSFFGAPRDGGRRSHHGVDIFAPRGTPVVSATDGYVTRVRTGGLGGKVVWVRSSAPVRHYYYAHLDEQLVRSNTRVQAGDTLGLVGNTGNARTTPPHLHFGIYSNGPLDPYPFVHGPTQTPPRVRVDTSLLGQWMRIQVADVHLRSQPRLRAQRVAALPQHTSVRIMGGSGAWYRVVLPDHSTGYVRANAVEAADQPLRTIRLTAARSVRPHPDLTAPAIDSVQAYQTIPVLGRFGDFVRIPTADEKTGWVYLD